MHTNENNLKNKNCKLVSIYISCPITSSGFGPPVTTEPTPLMFIPEKAPHMNIAVFFPRLDLNIFFSGLQHTSSRTRVTYLHTYIILVRVITKPVKYRTIFQQNLKLLELVISE